MRRLILLLALVVCLPVMCEARARGQGFCELGNQNVTITGAGTTTTDWQQSYPGCTVTVFNAGTAVLSTIFSDNVGTPLANPFTASATTGIWFFYADNGRYDVQLSGGGIATPFTLGDIFLIDTAGLGASTTAWSALTVPTGNLALSMSTFTTTFTWGNLATTVSGLTLVDGSGSTSTGAVLDVRSGSSSTMNPVQFTAQGTANGVEMTTAGLLQAIGTGGIAATTLACTTCISDAEVDATGITTRTKLPANVAYEDEANSFTLDQTFQQDILLRSGTGFAFTLGGNPTAARTINFPDSAGTLVVAATPGTAGTDIDWISGVLNVPTASATARGAVSTGAQTFAGLKTFGAGAASTFYASTAADTADTPVILRLANTETIGWEAAAPGTDLTMQVGAADTFLFSAALVPLATDPADSGVIRLDNADTICWEASPASTDACITFDSSEAFTITGGTFSLGAASATSLTIGVTDPADAGAIRLENAVLISWEASPAGTDESLDLDASENFGLTGPLELDATDPADAGALRLDNNEAIAWEASPTGTDITLGANISEVLVSSVQFDAPLYSTATNCSDSAGDAACAAAPAGSVVVDASDTTTVVSTTAVTANSQIFLQVDASLGTRLSVTCNTQDADVFSPRITARTAATSFTITLDAGPTTNPLCLSYYIIN